MSERIDEHWEYWMPSEEMAEAFPDAHVFDRNAAGYRRGNPNWCVFRYGRPKPDRLEKLDEWVSCPTCHESFKKLRHEQRYCSLRCRPGHRLPEQKCLGCGETFRPRRSSRLFHSKRCARLYDWRTVRTKAVRIAREKRRPKAPPVEFAAMFVGGAPILEIMQRFSITRCSVKRWRRRAGLDARLAGNHSRSLLCSDVVSSSLV